MAEESIHSDTLSTYSSPEVFHSRDRPISIIEPTDTLNNIVSGRMPAGWELRQSDHDELVFCGDQDGPSVPALVEKHELNEHFSKAGSQNHLQIQIAVSMSDGDSNSVQTYFSAQSAIGSQKARHIHSSASEGVLDMRYKAEGVKQQDDKRRASDEVDLKNRNSLDMHPNGLSTALAASPQTTNIDTESHLHQSSHTRQRAPGINMDNFAMSGQVPINNPADSEYLYPLHDDHPTLNDDQEILKDDSNTRGGGASSFLSVPAMVHRQTRSLSSIPSLSGLERADDANLSPGTPALRRFEFGRKKKRNRGEPPSSINHHLRNESVNTTRRTFLHFRNDDDNDKSQRRHHSRSQPYTMRNQLKNTIFKSWLNILLLLVPIGITLYCISAKPITIFVMNLISIVPLTDLLSHSVEEIALRVGQSFGIIFHAIFGNATCIIIVMLALANNNTSLIKLYLIGSVISNLLLCTGAGFFFGGLRRVEQYFNGTLILQSSSTILRAIISLLLPSLAITSDSINTSSPSLSRIAAIILLALYLSYLFHQIKQHSHASYFSEESKKVARRPEHALKNTASDPEKEYGKEDEDFEILKRRAEEKTKDIEGDSFIPPIDPSSNDRPPNDELLHTTTHQDNDNEEDSEEPQLHIYVALSTLAICLTLITFCFKFMTSQIQPITDAKIIPLEFLGLVLLPLITNFVDFYFVVRVAIADKQDLALAVPVGKSVDSILFIFPLVVIVGWVLGNKDMTLELGVFPGSLLLSAVLIFWSAGMNGISDYWTGVQMMGVWAFFAISSWFYELK